MKGKRLNLEDLAVNNKNSSKNSQKSNMKTVSISEMRPEEEKKITTGNDHIMSELDDGLARAARRYQRDIIDPQKKIIMQAIADSEMNDGEISADELNSRFSKMESINIDPRTGEVEAKDYSFDDDIKNDKDYSGEDYTHKMDSFAIEEDDGIPVSSKFNINTNDEEEKPIMKNNEVIPESNGNSIDDKATIDELERMLEDFEENEAEVKLAAKVEQQAPTIEIPVEEDAPVVIKAVEEPKEVKKTEEDTATEAISNAIKDTNDSVSEDIDLDDDAGNKKEMEAKAEEDRKKYLANAMKMKEQFSNLMGNKIKTDLSAFKISRKPVSISKVLNAVRNDKRASTWLLSFSERPVLIEEIGGYESNNIRNDVQKDLENQTETYRIIYNHIIDSNKGSFEEWLKTITIYDIQDLFFGVYRANFNDSNYIDMVCPNCGENFIANMDINEMVKFKDDDTKKKMQEILKKDTTSKSKYTTDLVSVNNIAVALRVPTLYSSIVEQNSFTDEFKKRNQDMLNTLQFIDNIYVIDKNSKMLAEVDTRPVADDIDKTIKHKVATYAKILRSLDSDEYSLLQTHITEFINKLVTDKISYQYPKCTCDKCHREIEEQEVLPVALFFQRSRLPRIMNISNE